MRVLVTGASGHIGSALVPDLLAAGYEVVGLARSDASAAAVSALGAEVHRGDLDDLDGLRRAVSAKSDAHLLPTPTATSVPSPSNAHESTPQARAGLLISATALATANAAMKDGTSRIATANLLSRDARSAGARIYAIARGPRRGSSDRVGRRAIAGRR